MCFPGFVSAQGNTVLPHFVQLNLTQAVSSSIIQQYQHQSIILKPFLRQFLQQEIDKNHASKRGTKHYGLKQSWLDQ